MCHRKAKAVFWCGFFIFVTKEKSENKKKFLCHKGFELTVFGQSSATLRHIDI